MDVGKNGTDGGEASTTRDVVLVRAMLSTQSTRKVMGKLMETAESSGTTMDQREVGKGQPQMPPHLDSLVLLVALADTCA
jgi:hypothetical protein